MGHAVVRVRLLLAVIIVGIGDPEAARAHAVDRASTATARVVVQVPAHIFVSAPVGVTVDLQNHALGVPIPAHVRFLVRTNAPEVELQVACTDLYKGGDPTCAYRIPVAGAGALITCEHGHGVAGSDSLLPWQQSPLPGVLPTGWSGSVTKAGIFTASPAAVFSQNVAVDVSWVATDPDLPLGEYRGTVKLIGLARP